MLSWKNPFIKNTTFSFFQYTNASNLLEAILEQYLFLRKTYKNVCTIKTGTNIKGS